MTDPKILKFKPAGERENATKRHNEMLVARVVGAPANPATPESDAAPENPNAQR